MKSFFFNFFLKNSLKLKIFFYFWVIINNKTIIKWKTQLNFCI